ncbi:MAG: ATP-binding protein [Nitrospira sp.]|nr:ATP-binding protein [Nitrospira sp.]
MSIYRALKNDAGRGIWKFLDHVHDFLQDIGRQTTLSLLTERILREFMTRTQCRYGLLYVRDQEAPGQYRLLSSATDEDDHQSVMPSTLSLSHPIVHQLAHSLDIIDWVLRDDGSLALKEPSPSPTPANLAIPMISRDRMIAFALLHADRNSPRRHSLPDVLLKTIAQGGANTLASLLGVDGGIHIQPSDRRAERLRSLETLARGFAHQIRNPLTSIKTFIQLAPERKDDAAFLREFSQVVLGDIYRIERLINEILDYSRSLEPQLAEEDINAIVTSCLYLLDPNARDRGIIIEQQLAPDLPPVLLDRQQIKHALIQVLSNSLDAMNGPGGILRIRTSVDESSSRNVRLDIEDTGRGISPADLEHIFDPFYTTKHTSLDHEGAGLGLFMAHQIIQEHRGTIHVRSEEGIGTTFCITFPAVG